MSIENQDKSKKLEALGLVWKPMLAYGLWFLVRNILNKVAFLEKNWLAFNDIIAHSYITISAKILQIFGMFLQYNDRNLILDGTEGIYVGNHCLGISAGFIFFFIIVLLKGRWKYKLPYLLFGLLVIYLLNLFRIIGLSLMLKWGSKAFFHFNHSYTYLIMIYGIIFLLIIGFEKRFSKR
jgi:exosortase/archaeosortase family protein